MLAILGKILEIGTVCNMLDAIQPSKEKFELNYKRITNHSEILLN